MRRAVVQNLRAVRRPNVARSKAGGNVVFHRSLASRSPSNPSSMRLRRVSLAVGAVAAGGAAIYQYRQSSNSSASPVPSASPTNYATPAAPGTTGPVSEEVADAVRRALIVEQGALYTSVIPDNQPLHKETDDYGRKVLEMLTAEQATQKLRTNQESYLVGRGSGVVRYDVVQIPSNDPIEDDHAEKIIHVPESVSGQTEGSDWMFWGVFDGHAGWTTSAKLRQTLISFVARELNTTYTAASANSSLKPPPADAVDAAIKKGFTLLDHEITHESVKKVQSAKSRSLAAELLAPALSGSCALLSFYDSRSKELRVACTGDSRAVLGRRASSGKWTATALSVDQTGGTESENERLRKEHPNEPYVTHNGRILGGLEPSRAFGDAVYKWSKETQDLLRKNFFTRSYSKYLKTPPYVTAEPVITTTKVQPEKGDFVVMATDGLWEMLTNEEVVGLVGMWLDQQAHLTPQQNQSWLKSWFGSNKTSALNVEGAAHGEDATGQRAPIRQQQWGVNDPEFQRFVVEDKNAATHLARNALGGKDQDTLSALLTLPSPYSRRYRDDLTIEVIFFGEGGPERTGKVELNKEASALSSEGVKPKL
ncbi:MgPP2CL-3, protein phosphatase 2C-like protein 3 [Aureobasidium pullulans]|uniref:MgPP2CL-3, protein phosphatase 2C-like protein 3 n=2 Tax=Aureobasidium pullulans TaxID=5580 RepID=A0A4S9B7B9_AURPU|nr:MgPP2CL-3, protein phosphatase 2C-like protein 3 [Aureobasidium pullulans]THW11824.1 MgPP2CL-3, protein phosphatase 2C-like protein 3 [Aureobasidium pullulans]THW47426.1 MgPP2CL-3, protein phosphatase 2C-like protein 3 [Aureobasidium pullulans]THW56936.1 MgPP2CL-3, protein phosphatase 2C-like protein 3 [Aureobasidium pullulans]THW88802.1 MgPP2CL-3, protein phosphatase 2C-like protein 3 [Aureobasidium pullulans]